MKGHLPTSNSKPLGPHHEQKEREGLVKKSINASKIDDADNCSKEGSMGLSGSQLFIISSYVGTWTCFYLLVHYGNKTYEHENGSSGKNSRVEIVDIQWICSAMYVMCVEVIKALACAALYWRAHRAHRAHRNRPKHTSHTSHTSMSMPSLKSFLSLSQQSALPKLFYQYTPISILYAMYNNLMLFNLHANHPTTYLIASSSRLVMTALAWRLCFQKEIGVMKWWGVAWITLGILGKDLFHADASNVEAFSTVENEESRPSSPFDMPSIIHPLLIVLQMSCSVLAGIYNEKLLKVEECHPYLQNIALYINSICINFLIGLGAVLHLVFGNGAHNSSFDTIGEIAQSIKLHTTSSPTSFLIILTLSLAGIISSLVLRYFSSITKGVASSSETILTSVIEYVYFGHAFGWGEVVGIGFVSLGTVCYSIPSSRTMLQVPAITERVARIVTTLGITRSRPPTTKRRQGEFCKYRMMNKFLLSAIFCSALMQFFSFRLVHVNEDVILGSYLSSLRSGGGAERTKKFQLFPRSTKKTIVHDRGWNDFSDSKLPSRPAAWRHSIIGIGQTVGSNATALDAAETNEFNFVLDDTVSSKDERGGVGFVTCIRSREDVIFALELVQQFRQLRKRTFGDPKPALELYHFSTISPFIVALMEIEEGVNVIDLDSSTVDLNSCVKKSLLVTHLSGAIIVEPNTLLLSSENSIFNSESIIQSFKDSQSDGHFVLSTSSGIDDSIAAAQSQITSRFQSIRFFTQLRNASVLQKKDIHAKDGVGSFHHVGTLYTYPFSVGFINLDKNILTWSKFYIRAQFVCGKSLNEQEDCIDVHSHIHKSLRRYDQWMTQLLLDRQVGWVAFDGGLVAADKSNRHGCTSFNSLDGAKRSLGASKSGTILNIDLVMTQDKFNLAMHSDELFGPMHAGENVLLPPSSVTLKDANDNLQNPCLSNDFIHKWFDGNSYRNYPSCDGCSQQVTEGQQIIDEVVLPNEVDVVFDLKAPTAENQQSQVDQILKLIYDGANKNESDVMKLAERVGVRYFPVDSNKKHQLGILPTNLLQRIKNAASDPKRKIRLYVNAPSWEACLQLAKWTAGMGSEGEWRKGTSILAGCFVNEHHLVLQKSWQETVGNHDVPKSLDKEESMKVICDVPREQFEPDVTLWKNGLISCMEQGFDWIHYPFPVAPYSDFSVVSSSILSSITLDETIVAKELSKFNPPTRKEYQDSSQLQKYSSYWGITSPYFYVPEKQQFSFVGSDMRPLNESTVASTSNHIFRCITKILTVMLFLRLEEKGMLSLDDLIAGAEGVNVSWFQVFSNTAGVDGTNAGKAFEYSASMWKYVESYIESITGVPFIEAISHYILDPMGLNGEFDSNTPYPPYTARGFMGTKDDLLIIGSTLASGGVSPQTRKRVISSASVVTMLHDWTMEQNVTASFMEEKTVKTMSRFGNGETDRSFASHGFVDGYGLGLWRVNGWRTREGMMEPVRGFMSLGSSEALLYFDEDGVVVAMLAPERVLGLELTAPFAGVVRELGSRLNNSYLLHGMKGNAFLRGKARR